MKVINTSVQLYGRGPYDRILKTWLSEMSYSSTQK